MPWIALSSGDRPELARNIQETTEAIEAGLRAQPENAELRYRRMEIQCFRNILLQYTGRTAEATVVLQETVASLRNTPRPSQIFDADDLLGLTNLALIRSLAQSGDTTRAKSLADSLLAPQNSNTSQSWYGKERRACVTVLVAGLLGSGEAARRAGLLDAAEKILSAPEAEGRLTVSGRNDLATIKRLRAEETQTSGQGQSAGVRPQKL